ncbi:MAG: hypothetical protein ACEPOW_07450 [Bacteroidales bacterium]
MSKLKWLIMLLAVVSVAACKKDKTTTNNPPKIDSPIIGTWLNKGYTIEPVFGQVFHDRTYTLNSDATYKFQEESYNSSRTYTNSYKEEGNFTLTDPEPGKSEEFAKALKEEVKLDKKLVGKSTAGTSTGYVEYSQDGKTFKYFFEDSKGIYYRRTYTKQ